MLCRSIYVENFRNIEMANVSFSEGVNVLVGENAQGKTNLLEAIYITALGKSFRQGNDRDMVRFGSEYCFVKNLYRDKIRDMEIAMRFFSDRRPKRIEQNKIRVAKTSEMVGGFRVVLFCPEHLSLVKDGPAERRGFLDVAISQIRPLYLMSLQKYQTILKERNSLIKAAGEGDMRSFDSMIDLFSEQLAIEAANITVYRAKYIKKLNEYVKRCFFDMTGNIEVPELSYISSSKVEGEDIFDTEKVRQAYMSLYFDRHDREIAAGSTLWGIHKDDIDILLNGNSARIFASQGQQRSISLALKLSEGEIIKNETGELPVFLFDDVLSELDGKRREYLLSSISDKQVIMTTCECGLVKADNLITVANGKYTTV